MGLSCCRPESPCGSVEERSSLLKDDAKAAAATGDTAVVGTCGPQGDEDMRKTTVDAILNEGGGDDGGVQVKLLPDVGGPEPIFAQENGSLQREAMHTSRLCPNKAAEDATREENMATHAKSADSEDSPAGAVEQPPASNEVEMQDSGAQKTEEDQNSPCKNTSICHHDDDDDDDDRRAIVANGCTLAMELCTNEDALSDTQESTVSTAHQEIKTESTCLVSEDPEDQSPAALMEGQDGKDFNGSDASEYKSKEVNHVGQERRPALPAAAEEPLTTALEDASHSQEEEEVSSENISQHAVDQLQDGECPKLSEAEEKMKAEYVQNDHVEDQTNIEIEEEDEENDPEGVVEHVSRTEDGLSSSKEKDLYGGADDQPASHNNNMLSAPLLERTLKARCSLGPPVDILSYSEREWQGHTAKSALIRKGYKEMSQRFVSVRQIRGDNYCALRATLFQALSQSAQVPTWLLEDDVAMLPQELAAQSGLISQWRFPGECVIQADVTQQLQSYVEILQNKWRAVAGCSSAKERLQLCEAIFQGCEEELAMLEALKLLMLARAMELHADMRAGRDVPLFCWLLFARDSSDCPRSFLINHLGHVGLDAGLEQVEMFLLGYALRCTIQVYRLYMVDTEEFVTYYPDDHKGEWPCVSLVTEDDRHYNVPVADAVQTAEEAESS
ncbi:uncharacterized protein LOC133630082 [Entelurus aequoreus]|uniref:uncharacterized protein LOC133630082 n=1 Tax=Entelurus aequoreus TaxID=161455 RepID=UPI002B1DFEF7|nr:uncharacterized protein LOC133630082 [Entelurus aequoreus]XP_061877342.1 uncharacterized protein LOC133630082 [Entelurus aequoreus]